MSTNWRRIADRLADRLECQAYQCPEAHNPLQPDDCPFCADTAAVEAYKLADLKAGRPR